MDLAGARRQLRFFSGTRNIRYLSIRRVVQFRAHTTHLIVSPITPGHVTLT